jgi:pilus assembly protein CpaE
MTDSAPPVPDVAAGAPKPRALVYVRDKESEGVIRQSLTGLGIKDMEFKTGGIKAATTEMANEGALKLLIVDAGPEEDLASISALLSACSPATGVIVLGESNDLSFYRHLRDAGVAEYIFKPLISTLVTKACERVLTGGHKREGPPLGQLISLMSVRGGAGATTLAVRLAWELARSPPRSVLMLDAQLRFGDAALQLDVAPNDALATALQSAERVDELFIERGVIRITDHLDLLATLAPLNQPPVFSEDAVLMLFERLQRRYRYIVIDVPAADAAMMPRALRLPSILVLVSDGRLSSAREVRRWREALAPETPERQVLHLVNRHGGPGDLPMEDFARACGEAPDFVIPFSRDIGVAANMGIGARPNCPDLQRGLAPLLQRIAGQSAAHPGSLLTRLFG